VPGLEGSAIRSRRRPAKYIFGWGSCKDIESVRQVLSKPYPIGIDAGTIVMPKVNNYKY
jgi:hypothetical protein